MVWRLGVISHIYGAFTSSHKVLRTKNVVFKVQIAPKKREIGIITWIVHAICTQANVLGSY